MKHDVVNTLEMRVMQVFSQSKLKKQDFASVLGVSGAVISHIQSGRNKASLEIVSGLLKHFPDISPDWLLFGQGNMHRAAAVDELKKWKKEMEVLLDRISRSGQDLNRHIEETRLFLRKTEEI